MVAAADYARSRERAELICDSAGDATALRLRLLDEIRRVIKFDAYVWVLTDPQTAVGSAPLAEVPCLPELPRLIRLKYQTKINRWTTLGNPPAASLHHATGGDLRRSAQWKELLVDYGICDVASSVFRDRFGCWGFLDLWRSSPAVPLSHDEVGYLIKINPAVTAALRRCVAATFAARAVSAFSPPPRTGPVVLLLSEELEVLAQTPETREYLRVLVPPTADRAPIPASAYNVAAQLLAVESGVDSGPPSARVHLGGGTWLTLRAARIGGHATGGGGIAVTIEQTSAGDRVALFSRAFGLSTRETELVSLLTTGCDTRDVSREMFLSAHTVQDHLKSIFAKTRTHSRRALLSRALGAETALPRTSWAL